MARADGDLDLPQLRSLAAERTAVDGRDGMALSDPLDLAEPCFVPRELLPILVRFDGRHRLAAIAQAATRELRQPVAKEFVEQLARDLDARQLLRSPTFFAARDQALATWLQGGVRSASHQGSAGYPAAPPLLRRALGAMVPGTAGDRPTPRGLIAPHIDLQRGRVGYAAAYGHLLGCAPADLYVLFGTGHQGPGAPVTGLPLDWQTPLGTAPTDRPFIAATHAAIGAATADDLLLHRREHSLEFQVLLLQHLHERRGAPPPQVAAFLCGRLPSTDGDPTGEDYLQRLLAAVRAAERQHGGRICYLAGADLAHLGPFFGDANAISDDLLARLERDERAHFAHLVAAAPGAFHRAVEGNGNPDRVCSAPAIALTALLAGGAAELLHYGQAVASDRSQVVSFCAAALAG